MPELTVTCRGVSRTYAAAGGGVSAVAGVDATFAPGSISALVGPSGCGKSTLLRLVAALDTPDAGTIRAGDLDVGSLHGRAERHYRRDVVAYLAQRPAANLVPHLTVAEQLGDHGGGELAETLGIASRLGARASELSGGEQARAGLATGLARGTPVVLVDEPTAELDRDSSRKVIAALRAAADRGRTIVVATHDPALVRIAETTIELGARTGATDPPDRETRATGPVVIGLQGLTKSYAGRPVVDGASLELRSGEIGVVLGRSGSGKSTLLMIAAGWTAADAGTASLPGLGWGETGYLPQRFGLLAELSVAENVALPLRIAGRDEAEAERLIDELALSGFRGRPPDETSIGQQQRTALARSLVLAPSAVLLDEPTSHQDGGSAELVWQALHRAADGGAACLVATHDESAIPHADRVWRIDDGRIAAAHDPRPLDEEGHV